MSNSQSLASAIERTGLVTGFMALSSPALASVAVSVSEPSPLGLLAAAAVAAIIARRFYRKK